MKGNHAQLQTTGCQLADKFQDLTQAWEFLHQPEWKEQIPLTPAGVERANTWTLSNRK